MAAGAATIYRNYFTPVGDGIGQTSERQLDGLADLGAALSNALGLSEEVTDDKSLDKAVRKQLQIDHAPLLSPRAKTIKLADKIANVQDVTDAPPADWSLARRIQYLDWTEKVVAGCRGTNGPLEKLYDEALKKGRGSTRARSRRS